MSQAGAIDGLQFARDRAERSGNFDLNSFSRLAQLGCSAAQIEYRLQGAENRKAKPSLRLSLRGSVVLICQRCLRPLEIALDVQSELELASSVRAINLAEDDDDRVLATPNMNIASLIEDEAILSLPMVPMHEHCVEVGEQSLKKPSPFAVLAKLKV
jgi:uncharacterized protein